MSASSPAMVTDLDVQAVKDYLLSLQDHICSTLESVEPSARFKEDAWDRPNGGGGRL